ncbi:MULTISPECIES: signal peptidase II [Sphingomonas]|jgi:signal peptidase II|uniref:Lipoprotein signal peptidase n=1 Tax=Sphingomonas hankookensis TaxID=563996 RepID=A0ABR5YB04_9SPHN|nr:MULTISPECIES: signal peptidase II [Sphingomonas]KZE11619.1 signal peptidase II [Sphingomonas hankookensis]PZT94345.1 MAG: signal peptidase II [Sphingomonas sp.]RSV33141.1 signal peptidase II [Sphingomonas sp. ABOLH]WCP72363.1 signal peptidase II [Sphingomonas hankookensis]
MSLRKMSVGIALLVLIVDQFVKYWVTGPMGIDYPGAELNLLPFFTLRFVQNFGVSLGLLQAGSEFARWALVAMTAIIATGVAVWIRRETQKPELIGLGLVLGGALGNIIDRVRFGYVVDYADFHVFGYSPFLVFNIADAAISIGVVILLVRALFTPKPKHDVPVEKANA